MHLRSVELEGGTGFCLRRGRVVAGGRVVCVLRDFVVHVHKQSYGSMVDILHPDSDHCATFLHQCHQRLPNVLGTRPYRLERFSDAPAGVDIHCLCPDNMLPHDAAQDASATRLFAGHVPPLHSELSEHVGPVVRNTCVLVGEALN